MTSKPDRWEFQLPEHPDRARKLRSPAPFEVILEEIKAAMRILCCHRDPIKRTNWRRVAYCVEVGQDLFDLFFNASTGYRAAYHRSPYEGLAANARALQVLAPALVAAGEMTSCDLDRVFIAESIGTPSAKIWLAEKGKEVLRNCPGCTGEWGAPTGKELNQPELLNGRWELRRDLPARWGSKAPYLMKLRILGAFLDDDHNEFVPAVKRFRAREIHDLGWS